MNRDKLDQVAKQFGSLQNLNAPMRVDFMFSVAWHLLNREDLDGTCLVYLHVENGIGIADRGVQGYTPTPCAIREEVDGQEAVDWFNKNILGLSAKESFKIVMSTMQH